MLFHRVLSGQFGEKISVLRIKHCQLFLHRHFKFGEFKTGRHCAAYQGKATF